MGARPVDRRLRRLFNRARLDENEVNILRGMLSDLPLTADQLHESQNVSETFPLEFYWNTDNLRLVAWVQDDATREMMQMVSSRPVPDHSLRYYTLGDRSVITDAAHTFGDAVLFTAILYGGVSMFMSLVPVLVNRRRGGAPVEGAAEALVRARAAGARPALVSNWDHASAGPAMLEQTRLADGLGYLWYAAGQFREGFDWCRALLDLDPDLVEEIERCRPLRRTAARRRRGRRQPAQARAPGCRRPRSERRCATDAPDRLPPGLSRCPWRGRARIGAARRDLLRWLRCAGRWSPSARASTCDRRR